MKSTQTSFSIYMTLILFVMASINANALTKKERNTKEDRVKGLVIFSMIKYVQWPEANKELIIGILSDDKEMIDLFNEMASSRSNSHKRIIVRSFSTLGEATQHSNILFIPNENSAMFEAYTKDIQNVLIITEKEGLCQHGSAINLITVNGKLRFEINRKAVEQSTLKVSSKLTEMGIEV
ncbi:YfiR family protein [Fulvivirga sp. 29W222]|uniref:YfiR family protein n=1 Tax=Fulvivirga marina TaxID=2494733 RepID=A0A937G377_9BACT|nr:YfiR family protein [Fulvivirga marina]MBL6449436.1 YfiR family protein [Fulvivirga marina]